MKLTNFLSTLVAVLAFSLPLASASCGSMSVGFDGDSCGDDNEASQLAEVLLHEAILDAVSAATGESKGEMESHTEFSTNRNPQTTLYKEFERAVVRRGNGDERQLATNDGDIEGQDERELYDCGVFCSCCGAWWCCMLCGWGCRRRELMEEAALASGTDFDAIAKQVCAAVKDKVANSKEAGCLSGAEMVVCEFLQ